jgi:hypothetical protein
VDACVARFATKLADDFLMQVTAIALCAGGSMAQHLQPMLISIQKNLNGYQEKILSGYMNRYLVPVGVSVVNVVRRWREPTRAKSLR